MEKTLALSKALADGNRLRVVYALLKHKELCVCQITALLGISTPSVSRHMSILSGAGVVASRKEGRWVFFRLHATLPVDLKRWLRKSLDSSDAALEDHKTLQTILSCPPQDLCRTKRIIHPQKGS